MLKFDITLPMVSYNWKKSGPEAIKSVQHKS